MVDFLTPQALPSQFGYEISLYGYTMNFTGQVHGVTFTLPWYVEMFIFTHHGKVNFTPW